MDRGVLKQVALGTVLVTLLYWVPGARADFVSSASPAELSPSRSITLNSWIPYRTEFSEVRNYLESAVKLRIGSGVVMNSRLHEDISFSASGSDCCRKPVSNNPGKLNDGVNHFDPGADASTTGTSSRPGFERSSQIQTCLLVPQEHIYIQVVAKVIADSKVVPGQCFQPNVFHPPRATSFL